MLKPGPQSVDFSFVVKHIYKGNTAMRSYLDTRLKEENLSGETIDIGGGKNAKYLEFMKRDGTVNFRTFDVKAGDTEIDFEKDKLPAPDGAYDTVLCLNVMEHIYNYQHFANELVRITATQGKLIGFVPFLLWYHPDHRDFFRYTHEALENIFVAAGAKEIVVEEIGRGPFIAAAQMILLSTPKFLRVPIFLFFWLFDELYQLLKGDSGRVYQLGYYFKVTK